MALSDRPDKAIDAAISLLIGLAFLTLGSLAAAVYFCGLLGFAIWCAILGVLFLIKPLRMLYRLQEEKKRKSDAEKIPS